MPDKKTAIITGASGGIGAGLVEDFWKKVITSSRPRVTRIQS